MKLYDQLTNLWKHIRRRRRVQLIGVFTLTIFSTLGELASIGAIVPFLAALTAPEVLLRDTSAQPILLSLGIEKSSQIIPFLTVFFAFAVVCAGFTRYLLMWAQTRLSFAIGADISAEIYQRTLYQPYEVHLSRNSSEIISAINLKVKDVINQSIGPSITIVSAVFLLISIGIFLFFINPVVAAASFFLFGGIYFFVAVMVKKRLILHGDVMASKQNEVVRTLQEGLMGIRDVLLTNSQEVYLAAFRNADKPVRDATANIIIISQAPRYAIEAAGMILIAVMAYVLVNVIGETAVLPILGALALGAQRMLPLLQQAYWSYSQMHGGQSTLNDVLQLLDQPLPEKFDKVKQVKFEKEIYLEKIEFCYENGRSSILNGINLRIHKGASIGIIGETGSGKSTFVDLIMGLVPPTSGKFLVDGLKIGADELKGWQKHIAHVPQSIYLTDASIAQNIAFGIKPEKIDMSRVMLAAQKAQLHDVIESWQMKYETLVGEQGARLSGGQRQRIGIARALYREASLIVFDEATSALDSETEMAVMESIHTLDREITILIIAHRINTLKRCDMILEIAKGKVSEKKFIDLCEVSY
jgi:ABC-type bacteriocin/lantibiotic exporter with double-glycine peptidase domain